jgi:hypothetical protein
MLVNRQKKERRIATKRLLSMKNNSIGAHKELNKNINPAIPALFL